jgi:hypothetical protein
MSADNFVVVRKFKDGYYWAIGFATYCIENNLSFDKGVKPQSFVNGPFNTIEEASNHANKELGIIEYGIVTTENFG